MQGVEGEQLQPMHTAPDSTHSPNIEEGLIDPQNPIQYLESTGEVSLLQTQELVHDSPPNNSSELTALCPHDFANNVHMSQEQIEIRKFEDSLSLGVLVDPSELEQTDTLYERYLGFVSDFNTQSLNVLFVLVIVLCCANYFFEFRSLKKTQLFITSAQILPSVYLTTASQHVQFLGYSVTDPSLHIVYDAVSHALGTSNTTELNELMAAVSRNDTFYSYCREDLTYCLGLNNNETSVIPLYVLRSFLFLILLLVVSIIILLIYRMVFRRILQFTKRIEYQDFKKIEWEQELSINFVHLFGGPLAIFDPSYEATQSAVSTIQTKKRGKISRFFFPTLDAYHHPYSGVDFKKITASTGLAMFTILSSVLHIALCVSVPSILIVTATTGVKAFSPYTRNSWAIWGKGFQQHLVFYTIFVAELQMTLCFFQKDKRSIDKLSHHKSRYMKIIFSLLAFRQLFDIYIAYDDARTQFMEAIHSNWYFILDIITILISVLYTTRTVAVALKHIRHDRSTATLSEVSVTDSDCGRMRSGSGAMSFTAKNVFVDDEDQLSEISENTKEYSSMCSTVASRVSSISAISAIQDKIGAADYLSEEEEIMTEMSNISEGEVMTVETDPIYEIDEMDNFDETNMPSCEDHTMIDHNCEFIHTNTDIITTFDPRSHMQQDNDCENGDYPPHVTKRMLERKRSHQLIYEEYVEKIKDIEHKFFTYENGNLICTEDIDDFHRCNSVESSNCGEWRTCFIFFVTLCYGLAFAVVYSLQTSCQQCNVALESGVNVPGCATPQNSVVLIGSLFESNPCTPMLSAILLLFVVPVINMVASSIAYYCSSHVVRPAPVLHPVYTLFIQIVKKISSKLLLSTFSTNGGVFWWSFWTFVFDLCVRLLTPVTVLRVACFGEKRWARNSYMFNVLLSSVVEYATIFAFPFILLGFSVFRKNSIDFTFIAYMTILFLLFQVLLDIISKHLLHKVYHIDWMSAILSFKHILFRLMFYTGTVSISMVYYLFLFLDNEAQGLFRS
ncbi:hypothetical protein PCE1_004543 [Barthelona sp. PCE]